MTTVVLCGSARFEAGFKEASKRLGLMGYVVIGLSSYPSENGDNKDWYNAVEKEMLDLVHLEKVQMADVILVIDGNPTFGEERSFDPYFGYSTSREILWARMHDRPLISLMSVNGWGQIGEMIDNRYDIEQYVNSDWIVEHANQVLKTEAANKLVSQGTLERQHHLMHGTLSVLACKTGTVATFAETTLVEAGLDPLDDVGPAFAGTNLYTPDELTINN